ncbi:MAG: hypothetical protein HP497_12665 [Nitrospira sp.]|nr:hypothetical protein [Nitrospira sp.]
MYDRTIDYGAHPNEQALMQVLQLNESAEHVELKMNYLDGDSIQLRLTLKTTAQVGVCSLTLFRSVYKERFDILGVTGAIDYIKNGSKDQQACRAGPAPSALRANVVRRSCGKLQLSGRQSMP